MGILSLIFIVIIRGLYAANVLFQFHLILLFFGCLIVWDVGMIGMEGGDSVADSLTSWKTNEGYVMYTEWRNLNI